MIKKAVSSINKCKMCQTEPMKHLLKYKELTASPSPAPSHWASSYTHRECSLHQISPYIGKLKSIIAKDLISKYSKPGQLVVDMFCGSGTVPLEAAHLGRRVFASDASIYAITLTKAKLYAPNQTEAAFRVLDKVFGRLNSAPTPDLRGVPRWVRDFYHPRTLKETLQMIQILKRDRNYFLLGSMLGILHHQRPGFLSYPSSHLVPYLRSRRFPKAEFPELYKYRRIEPRLKAKVERTLKRTPEASLPSLVEGIRLSSAQTVRLPKNIDCVVTSPPYMNALDYQRDNRLRLWFLGELQNRQVDRAFATVAAFRTLMETVAKQLNQKMRRGGYCIFVVGEKTFRGINGFPSEVLAESFLANAPTFQIHDIIADRIPDIRRSRQHLAGVKQENILVFKKD